LEGVDENIVLGEVAVALETAFDGCKGVLGDSNAFVVGRLDQFDDRVRPFPGHGPGPFDHGIDAVQ
jgi:hypothetical protein